MNSCRTVIALIAIIYCHAVTAAPSNYDTAIEHEVRSILPQVIAWRRDIHQHPELGYEETRTAQLVATHLRSLGLEVKTGIAHTGVIGILRGGSSGPVVALRSELDALPGVETADVPFASKVHVTYHGQDSGVMHACGHDTHIAILMGAATVLSRIRSQLHGTVVFIFQPNEEQTADATEKGGAALMIEEGLMGTVRPSAIFALHVTNQFHSGEVRLATGTAKAGSDALEITITGKQVHAARPWDGVDPIVTAAQIILGLQTVISREIDPTTNPSVLFFGMINGGVRPNIIPKTVTLNGGLRWFNDQSRMDIRAKIERTVQGIATGAAAKALVNFTPIIPPVINNAELAHRMNPTLVDMGVTPTTASTTSDDIAYFMENVPGLYFFLGGTPQDKDPASTAANHSPLFFVDESTLSTGVKLMSRLAAGYLNGDQRTRSYKK